MTWTLIVLVGLAIVFGAIIASAAISLVMERRRRPGRPAPPLNLKAIERNDARVRCVRLAPPLDDTLREISPGVRAKRETVYGVDPAPGSAPILVRPLADLEAGDLPPPAWLDRALDRAKAKGPDAAP